MLEFFKKNKDINVNEVQTKKEVENKEFKEKKEFKEEKVIDTNEIIEKTFEFRSDVVDWHYDDALEIYLKEKNKSYDDFDNEDVENVLKYSGNHIVYFLTWIIQNDFYNIVGEGRPEEETTELMADIEVIKSKKQTAYKFLCDYCDSKLWRCDFAESILEFVDSYYIPDYMMDYMDYVELTLGKRMYGLDFDWDEYDRFKGTIDNAYKIYLDEK